MTTRRIVAIAVFTALIIVGGLISVPIPFAQIELSFQTVFVIMSGLLLGGANGALSVVIYIVMGLIGIPVFTQGGGPAYIFMPSFGYLIGFPIAALVSGAIVGHLKHMTRGKVFMSTLVGMAIVYAIGVPYQVGILYWYMGNTWAAATGGLAAVGVLALKDAVLLGVVSALYPSLERALRPYLQKSGKQKKCAREQENIRSGRM